MLVLVVVILSFGTVSVLACPPQPTCPEGTIEISPAERVVEGRYGFYTWHGWTWREWREVDSCKAGWQLRGWDLVYWQCRQVGWTEPVCIVPTPTPTPVPTEVPTETPEPTEEPTPEPTLVPTETKEPEPTLEPTLVPTQCIWKQYVLVGENGRTCYLKRAEGDKRNVFPERFGNPDNLSTTYQFLCDQTCTGRELPTFVETGKWYTTCQVCDEACE